MRLIRRGDRSPAVFDLHARLARLGFEVAAERGQEFGPATEAAVMQFQQQRGLDVDGIVGPATWREVVESSWQMGERVLRLTERMMRGDDVRRVQERLNSMGFTAGKHDGIFGPRTAAAVAQFQSNFGIEEDGIVGRETARALQGLSTWQLDARLGPRVSEREARKASPRGVRSKKIVIDPGHGGTDAGELGPNGDTEAAAALRIGRRLKDLLEEQGASAALTRRESENPGSTARARVANDLGADLFISIHLNAHPSPNAEGAASYFFSAAEVGSEPGEHLANLVQEALRGTGRRDCRAHGKSYPVLRETSMPAVVVEPAFITSPDEARMLSDPAGVDAIAKALTLAVEAYFSGDSG